MCRAPLSYLAGAAEPANAPDSTVLPRGSVLKLLASLSYLAGAAEPANAPDSTVLPEGSILETRKALNIATDGAFRMKEVVVESVSKNQILFAHEVLREANF